MAKRKQGKTAVRVQPPKKKGIAVTTWVGGAVALIAVAVFAIIASGGSGAAPGGATGSTAGAVAPLASASPEELKYIGRLLPAGYTEPSVAPAAAYASRVNMSDVTVTQDKKQTSISVSEVVAKKIVFFEYRKEGSDPVPMVAYVKPSGKLFIGVSYCIPCKGTKQRIEADGTLTCESCGTRRDLETGVGISGACKLYPLDELPATVSGDSIVLQNSAIDEWIPQRLDRKVG